MNVSLTAELESFVNSHVRSGMYTSASEVVREGLRLLRAREEREQARLKALREAVDEGLTDIDRGDVVDGHDSFARVMAELEREGDA